MNISYKCCSLRRERKRPLSRPRIRRKDVKACLKDVGYRSVEPINLARVGKCFQQNVSVHSLVRQGKCFIH